MREQKYNVTMPHIEIALAKPLPKLEKNIMKYTVRETIGINTGVCNPQI
jgi:hypothetical protein